jgi:hypothetical protein
MVKQPTRKARGGTRETMDFMYFPDIDSDDFPKNIYRKKDFHDLIVDESFADTKAEDLCGLKRQPFPYQEFVHNFISIETPYNGILLFHGVGTGKTCSAITMAEGLRPYVEANRKNIYIISPGHVETNFRDELYSFSAEAKEEEYGLNPGSRQCTGLTYWLPKSDDKDARKKAIVNRIKSSVYKFYGIGAKFPNEVAKMVVDYNISLKEKFSNCVFIIDEAHNIVTKKVLDIKLRQVIFMPKSRQLVD